MPPTLVPLMNGSATPLPAALGLGGRAAASLAAVSGAAAAGLGSAQPAEMGAHKRPASVSSSAAAEHEQREAAAREKQPPAASHRGPADSLSTAAGAAELGSEGAGKTAGRASRTGSTSPRPCETRCWRCTSTATRRPSRSKFKKEPALTAGRLLGFEANLGPAGLKQVGAAVE